MKIIDTHAHICDPSFDTDRDDILERARKNDIVSIVAVSENKTDAEKNIQLSSEYTCIKAAVGLYPSVLDDEKADEIIEIIRKERDNLVGIGEVGLDYWLAKTDDEREIQRRIFSKFIKLSLEVDLPLNVHSRSAGFHAIELLIQKGARKVQMHAFDGKASKVKNAIEAGFFFSIPPSIIRSRQKQKLIKQLPLDCLLLESDAPVLGPDPNERNEPMNVKTTLSMIAEIKELPEEVLSNAIFDNSLELYGTKIITR